jgi:hypothetical protein
VPDGELYSYMVVMALVTTMMAGPLLQWIYPTRKARTEGLAEEKTEDARLSPTGTGGDPSEPD